MALIPQRELERFFAEVGPRLETAQTLDDELDRQLARRFNVFRYLRTDEMGFSRIIADLLNPAGDHGQGAAFLELLTAKLDFASGVDLGGAKVQTERQIVDRRRIDIVVEIDSKHCLAIENKSNFADDQEGQVADYLHWLSQYSQSLLVYLSPTGDGPREGSVAREDLETETTRRFVIMPCDSSNAPDDEFNELRLSFSLADWLADCRRNCDIDRLRWYLREAETYCRRRYGGVRVTDSKKSTIKEFVRGDKMRLTSALAIYETWPELAQEIKCKFLELIYDEVWNDPRIDGECLSWDYGPGAYQSYVLFQRESWQPYVVGDQEQRTGLYLQAESKDDADWYIGVWSPSASEVVENDRERREKLQQQLGELQIRQHRYYPCWEKVKEEYRDWNPLIPRMNEELGLRKEGGGEIATYFVREFICAVKQMTEIIDRVDN